jgi:hypothetical protein
MGSIAASFEYSAPVHKPWRASGPFALLAAQYRRFREPVDGAHSIRDGMLRLQARCVAGQIVLFLLQ